MGYYTSSPSVVRKLYMLKKIDTKRVGVVCFLLIFATFFTGTALFPAHVDGAVSKQSPEDAGKQLCDAEINVPSATGGSSSGTNPSNVQKRVDRCVKGFVAAQAKNAPKITDIQSKKGPCYTSIFKNDSSAAFDCQLGYVMGYRERGTFVIKNVKPPTEDDKQKSEANEACMELFPNSGGVLSNMQKPLLGACVDGYMGAIQGKTKEEVCNGPLPLNRNYCEKGWDMGEKTADGAPNCESSGWNLSWIVCPVIDGLAEAIDTIYKEMVRPLLQINPIEVTNPEKDDTNVYKVWSNFRIYGNIILILALLAIVIAESIGGGIFEAYAVRKALPRLLIAAILINLSIYIVAVAVDISNVVGRGIQALIEAPFRSAGDFEVHVGFGASVGIGIGALLGLGAAGGISGLWATVFSGPFLQFVLLFVLLPAFLTMVAVVVTILIRIGLILFLTMISPVAFALYCLPNTEQYFRRWWDLLFRTLLVYPIIAVMFALANVLAVTLSSISSGVNSGLLDLMSIVAMLAPLFLIPFSFRMAGGVLGKAMDTAQGLSKRGTEAIKGNANDPHSLRNRKKQDVAAKFAAGRQRALNRAEKVGASRARRYQGKVTKLFGDPERTLAAQNKRNAEFAEMVSATGDDSLRYAAAGYKIAAGEAAFDGSVANHDRWFDGKSREITQDKFNRGKSTFGATMNGVGANLEYDLRKAQTNEDVAKFRFAFAQNAKQGNWDEDEMLGVWAQATYPHKDKWASEWYSTPTAVDGKSARNGIQFQDVSTHDGSFDKMQADHWGLRASHQFSAIRASDWHVYGDRFEKTQRKLESGQQVSEDELRRYAKTSEMLDTMVRSGAATQNDDGEIVMTGASPEVQNIVSGISKMRAGWTVTNAPGGGVAGQTDRVIQGPPAPPPGGQAGPAAPRAPIYVSNVAPDRSEIETRTTM